MQNSPWYTNKELFEKINDMRDDFVELKSELKETRVAIKKYNGLREELSEVKKQAHNMEKRINEMQAKAMGRLSVGESIKSWGGWIFALISLIVAMTTMLSK